MSSLASPALQVSKVFWISMGLAGPEGSSGPPLILKFPDYFTEDPILEVDLVKFSLAPAENITSFMSNLARTEIESVEDCSLE